MPQNEALASIWKMTPHDTANPPIETATLGTLVLVSLQMILHTSMKSMSNQGERSTHTYEESRCQDQLILLFHFDVFIVY
jgi:hypothetical protein